MNEVSGEAVSEVGNNGVVNAIVQYKVPFYEAAKRYVTKPTSKGRSSRSEFWWGILFSFIIDLGLEGLSVIVGNEGVYLVGRFANAILKIGLWWRRMHDLGKSGWWFIVPFYNLYLAVKSGEMTENEFGPVPNTQPIVGNVFKKIIIIGVTVAMLLLALIGGCLLEDPVEDTLYTD